MTDEPSSSTEHASARGRLPQPRAAASTWAVSIAGILVLLLASLAVAQSERPDPILLPDLRVLPPSGLYIVDEAPGGPKRLKFTTSIWNAGAGPLEVHGEINPRSGELEVIQMLYRVSGVVSRGGFVGTFNYAHRHGHLHLDGFARYQLWSLDAAGRRLELIAENHKVGFCLMDTAVIDIHRANGRTEPVYWGCESEVQGISPGHGDIYVAELWEQDLDITTLPDGRYELVNIANPDGWIAELSHGNNSASRTIRIRDGTVTVVGS